MSPSRLKALLAGQPLREGDALTVGILHEHQRKVILVAIDPHESTVSWRFKAQETGAIAPALREAARRQEAASKTDFSRAMSNLRNGATLRRGRACSAGNGPKCLANSHAFQSVAYGSWVRH